jgi:hypothetical protein
MKHERKELSQPIQALPEINMILEGFSTSKYTSNRKRKYGKQVVTTTHQQDTWYELITFTLDDRDGVIYPFEDALLL